jgi:hypothetical protein
MRQSSTSEPAATLESEQDLVADLSQRLVGAIEVATQEHGQQLIAEIFSNVFAEPRTGRERRARKQSDREIRRTLNGLTKQFVDAIEKCTRAHRKELRAEEKLEQAAAAQAEKERAKLLGLRKPRRHRKPVRPAPPPLDPEQIKRDAENARLRALLKPVADEAAAVPVAPAPFAPLPEPVRPSTPGDLLRSLEKEIQDAVPTLGTLGPERCAAQIAVWSGQIRQVRDRLPPDVAATMRPAFRIFLEHLTQLQAAMEAQVVDALEPTFTAPDWDTYVEANRARVEQRPPRLSDDRLQVHHRTMLRALILPHRRNANQETIAIIDAAKRGLPTNDPQLQSALRRFASLLKAAHQPPPPSPSEQQPPADGQGGPPHIPSAEGDNQAATAAQPSESEFDSPWVK